MTEEADVVIIDYGIGNLASVKNMLKFVGATSVITSDPETIRNAKKLVLPGIGNFEAGMAAFTAKKLNNPLRDAISNNSMLLGICLGFQLLFEESEESPGQQGLGLIKGKVKKFQVEGSGLRVPHIGWNIIHPRPNSRLFNHDLNELRYYFVHSYFAECNEEDVVAATCDYGGKFTCAIEKANVFGVQFHPEKSHKFGVDIFTRFVNL